MMQFGNLNIREGITKEIGLIVLAGSMAVTMCGCGSKKEPKPTVKVPTSATIGGTLDTISDLTAMDEILAKDKFVNKSDGKEYTFNELLNLYNEARREEDLSACNTLLYKIGRMIMKAQLAEALGIEPEQITSLSIDGSIGDRRVRTTTITYKIKQTDVVAGGIEISKEQEVTREFATIGEMDDLAINIARACNHSLEFNDDSIAMDLDIDNVYKSFVEHLLTTTTIKKVNVIFGDDYYDISAELSQDKVDTFNAHNNGVRSSSTKYSYNYNGNDRGISLSEAIRAQKQEQSINMTTKALGSYQAKRLYR